VLELPCHRAQRGDIEEKARVTVLFARDTLHRALGEVRGAVDARQVVGKRRVRVDPVSLSS
jgi:hypothetical protein